MVQYGLGSSSGPRGCVWGLGCKAVSGQGVLAPQSGSPGPGFLPPLGLHAWGAAGGFPLLLKIRSKNSTGFWHRHRTGCRGNAAVGEEGGRHWVWAAWVARAPHRQGDAGDNLSASPRPSVAPLPVLAAWFPSCSSFWVCWGGSSASPHEAPQMLHSHGWHSWSHGDMALSSLLWAAQGPSPWLPVGALPVDLIPSSGLGLGCSSAPTGGNRKQEPGHSCTPAGQSLSSPCHLPPCTAAGVTSQGPRVPR